MPRICKIFEVTRTIYSNSERSEQFLETECFLTCFTFMFSFYGKFIICIFCWKICFVNKFVNNVWFCFEMKKPSIYWLQALKYNPKHLGIYLNCLCFSIFIWHQKILGIYVQTMVDFEFNLLSIVHLKSW